MIEHIVRRNVKLDEFDENLTQIETTINFKKMKRELTEAMWTLFGRHQDL